jgi:hypothetical protein
MFEDEVVLAAAVIAEAAALASGSLLLCANLQPSALTSGFSMQCSPLSSPVDSPATWSRHTAPSKVAMAPIIPSMLFRPILQSETNW